MNPVGRSFSGNIHAAPTVVPVIKRLLAVAGMILTSIEYVSARVVINDGHTSKPTRQFMTRT